MWLRSSVLFLAVVAARESQLRQSREKITAASPLFSDGARRLANVEEDKTQWQHENMENNERRLQGSKDKAKSEHKEKEEKGKGKGGRGDGGKGGRGDGGKGGRGDGGKGKGGEEKEEKGKEKGKGEGGRGDPKRDGKKVPQDDHDEKAVRQAPDENEHKKGKEKQKSSPPKKEKGEHGDPKRDRNEASEDDHDEESARQTPDKWFFNLQAIAMAVLWFASFVAILLFINVARKRKCCARLCRRQIDVVGSQSPSKEHHSTSDAAQVAAHSDVRIDIADFFIDLNFDDCGWKVGVPSTMASEEPGILASIQATRLASHKKYHDHVGFAREFGLPDDLKPISDIVSLSPHGTHFAKPLEIRIPVCTCHARALAAPRLWRSVLDERNPLGSVAWEEVPGGCIDPDGTFRVLVDHFCMAVVCQQSFKERGCCTAPHQLQIEAYGSLATRSNGQNTQEIELRLLLEPIRPKCDRCAMDADDVRRQLKSGYANDVRRKFVYHKMDQAVLDLYGGQTFQIAIDGAPLPYSFLFRCEVGVQCLSLPRQNVRDRIVMEISKIDPVTQAVHYGAVLYVDSRNAISEASPVVYGKNHHQYQDMSIDAHQMHNDITYNDSVLCEEVLCEEDVPSEQSSALHMNYYASHAQLPRSSSHMERICQAPPPPPPRSGHSITKHIPPYMTPKMDPPRPDWDQSDWKMVPKMEVLIRDILNLNSMQAFVSAVQSFTPPTDPVIFVRFKKTSPRGLEAEALDACSLVLNKFLGCLVREPSALTSFVQWTTSRLWKDMPLSRRNSSAKIQVLSSVNEAISLMGHEQVQSIADNAIAAFARSDSGIDSSGSSRLTALDNNAAAAQRPRHAPAGESFERPASGAYVGVCDPTDVRNELSDELDRLTKANAPRVIPPRIPKRTITIKNTFVEVGGEDEKTQESGALSARSCP